jgi:hypothetical protein
MSLKQKNLKATLKKVQIKNQHQKQEINPWTIYLQLTTTKCKKVIRT